MQKDINNKTESLRDKRQRILICDSENLYGERLLEYLQQNLLFPCDVELYTSAARLQQLGKPELASLVIMSEREFSDEILKAGWIRRQAGTVCDHRCKESAGTELLVLNETGDYLGTDVRNISKYQSMDTICTVVSQMALGDEGAVPGMIRHGTGMQLIGFYSPISRCLQTTTALTFGQFLARKHKVLYLNYETYSGLEELLHQSFGGSVADLLYYNECAREKLPTQLGLLTRRLNGLDYIPPMKSFIELHAIKAEQWLSLFQTLEQMTEYEYVLLDLTEMVEGLFTILRKCSQILTIVREDVFSLSKINAYEEILQEMGYADIAAKTDKWNLPIFQELPAAMDNMTHGEMAEYVRRQMEELGDYDDEPNRVPDSTSRGNTFSRAGENRLHQ